MYLDCFIETLLMHNSKLYRVLKGKNIYWLSVSIPDQDDEHPQGSYQSPPEHRLGIVTLISKYLEEMADPFKFIRA